MGRWLKCRQKMRSRWRTRRNRARHNLRCCGWSDGLVSINPLGDANPVVAALTLTAGAQPSRLKPRRQRQRDSGFALRTERVEIFSKSHGQLLKTQLGSTDTLHLRPQSSKHLTQLADTRPSRIA